MTLSAVAIKRVIKAHRDSGLPVGAVIYGADGSVTILTEAPKVNAIADPLKAWEQKRGKAA